MFKLSHRVVLLSAFVFAAWNSALAQVQVIVPADHQEFLSGGAINPDMDEPNQAGPFASERGSLVGANVRVNAQQQGFPNGLFGRSETTIASSGDGSDLLAGYNNAQGFCGPPFGVACTPMTSPGLSGFAFSINGGSTWNDAGAPDPKVFNNVFTRGDPWMDRGGIDGDTFFYANLAIDAKTAAGLGVSMHRGHFSGSNFSFEDVRVLNSPNPNDFYDKEAIAAAKDGSGGAYVTLTNFKELCGVAANGLGEITVWRTHDGGNSWQGPVVAGPDLTDPGCASGVLQQSSVPAIGPHGEVYVTWQRGPSFTSSGTSTDAQIVVARSLDGGVTFDTPVTVAAINSMRQNPPVAFNRGRINDHPRIAVANSGPHAGRIYVAFYSAVSPVAAAPTVPCPATLPAGTVCIGQNLVSSQVFLSFSDDKGSTWSTPVAVGPPMPGTGLKRWWPVVTVEPNGYVDVVYLESEENSSGSFPQCIVRLSASLRRVGDANSLVDTFWAQSRDGGSSFREPVEVSSSTSNWCTVTSNVTPNLGDYIGSASAGALVLPIWADGRDGVPDTFFAPIFGGSRQ